MTLDDLTRRLQTQDDATPFHGKCVSCVSHPDTFYYCSALEECHMAPVDKQACESGIMTCLAYKAKDLGMKVIPPYNRTTASFFETI